MVTIQIPPHKTDTNFTDLHEFWINIIKSLEKIRANWWNWCHFHWICKAPEWLQKMKKYRRNFEEVAAAIREDREPSTSAASARPAVALIHEIYESTKLSFNTPTKGKLR